MVNDGAGDVCPAPLSIGESGVLEPDGFSEIQVLPSEAAHLPLSKVN